MRLRVQTRVVVQLGVLAMIVFACATIPEQKMDKVSFPKETAYMGDVKGRPYEKLGLVRARKDFLTLDVDHDEKELCQNYFNKAVRDLVKEAKKQGGDAVIDVKSIVFYEDGSSKLYKTPECSDEGQDGQILTQGIAIKWRPLSDTDDGSISPKNPKGFVPEKQSGFVPGFVPSPSNN
jgi:hypothetical protein